MRLHRLLASRGLGYVSYFSRVAMLASLSISFAAAALHGGSSRRRSLGISWWSVGSALSCPATATAKLVRRPGLA